MADDTKDALDSLMKEALFEELARIEHERWAHWQTYFHEQLRKELPGPALERVIAPWERQRLTTYDNLTEREKEADRGQVMRYWPLIENLSWTLPSGMRIFKLYRHEDETGISGTGTVALGVVFPDGRVEMRWQTKTASTTSFDRIRDVEEVHGHNGKTSIVWLST